MTAVNSQLNQPYEVPVLKQGDQNTILAAAAAGTTPNNVPIMRADTTFSQDPFQRPTPSG